MPGIRPWLEAVGLPQYADAFERNDIDVDILGELSEEDLHRLGVTLGHGKRILRALRDPSQSDAAPNQPPESITLDGERRQVTVLFCDLVGSTALSGRLDPEAYRALLATYHQIAVRAIQRFDGYVAQVQGDGILAYFGYPLAHEGEADRAIHAGLEILAAMEARNATAGEKLSARVGIASGLVVVSHILSPDKSAVGETPNLASRLQSSASPGEILVTTHTRELAGGAFEYEDLGQLHLKGIEHPVHGYRVTGCSAVASRFDASNRGQLTPLVGRVQEVNLLLDRWQVSRGGEGQVVLLQGEPGIGKSRMLLAVRERLSDALEVVLQFQCSPYYCNSAFYPFVDQIERALGLARQDGAEAKLDRLEAWVQGQMGRSRTDCSLLARAMAIACGQRYGELEMSPQRQKEDTIALLADLIAHQAQRSAVAVLFEDVHWADPTSVEVLTALVDRAAAVPLLVLMTYRPEFTPPWLSRTHVTLIALNRLSRAQGARVVLGVVGDKPLPAELVEQIVDKTDGVPLFLEELTKAVRESEMLVDMGDRYGVSGRSGKLTIPNTLRDSLMARLDRLIPVKEIAQIGAVIGREFSHELVRAVTSMREAQLDEALERLTESGLVFRRGAGAQASYLFKHALVQDAAYDSLLVSKRQALHEQIADAIEARMPEKARSEPELLAHHYTEAGCIEQALPYWQRAGELAQQRVALQEAIGYFQRGLALAHQLAPSHQVDVYRMQFHALLGMAWLAQQGWGHPQVAANLQPAYDLEERLTPGVHSLRVLWGLWVYPLATGRPRESLPLANELLAQARKRGDEYMLHAGLWAQVTTYYWLAEYEEAIKSADAIIAGYDAVRHRWLAETLSHDSRTVAMQYKAASLHALGYPERALQLMHATLEHARARNHPFDHVWALYFAMAQLHALRNDGSAIEKLLIEFEPRAQSQRLLFFERVLGPYCRAIADRLEGRVPQAAQTLSELETAMESAGLLNVLSELRLQRAECSLDLGEPHAALQRVQEVNRQISMPGHELGYLLVELRRIEAVSMVAIGKQEEGEAAFKEALAVAARQGAKWWELRAARFYASFLKSKGRCRDAQSVLHPICEWFSAEGEATDILTAKALLREIAGQVDPVARLR